MFSHLPLLLSTGPIGIVSELAFQDSSDSSNQATITIPSTVTKSDIAVISDIAVGSNSQIPAEVVPTGWTKITTVPSTGSSFFSYRNTISYKILDAGEASQPVTGQSGIYGNRKLMLVFRPDGEPSTINVSTVNQEFSNSDPSAQVISADLGNEPLIVLASYASVGEVTSDTFSPASDGRIGGTSDDILVCRYKIYNASAQETTVDINPGTDSFLISFYLEVS